MTEDERLNLEDLLPRDPIIWADDAELDWWKDDPWTYRKWARTAGHGPMADGKGCERCGYDTSQCMFAVFHAAVVTTTIRELDKIGCLIAPSTTGEAGRANGDIVAAVRALADIAADAISEPPKVVFILAHHLGHASRVARDLGLNCRQWRYVHQLPSLMGIGRGQRFYVADTFWERDDAHELYNCATENRRMVEVTSEELEAMRREAAR